MVCVSGGFPRIEMAAAKTAPLRPKTTHSLVTIFQTESASLTSALMHVNECPAVLSRAALVQNSSFVDGGGGVFPELFAAASARMKPAALDLSSRRRSLCWRRDKGDLCLKLGGAEFVLWKLTQNASLLSHIH
jgi:hypothetical protein